MGHAEIAIISRLVSTKNDEKVFGKIAEK